MIFSYKKALLLVAFLVACVTCQTLNDTKVLNTNMMTGYSKYVRPIDDQTQPVVVNMTMELVGVQDFDEVSESLTFIGVLVLYWKDASMIWNPADYGSQDTFTTSYKNVWVPELILINPSQAINSLGSEWQIVRYFSDGAALWSPGNLWKTSCSLDVTKFPFDTQRCEVQFLPWGYDKQQVSVNMMVSQVQRNYYSENGGWDLVNSETRVDALSESTQAVFVLHLKRKPLYVVVNVLLPILFLSLLNTLVFLIPVDSGERISYSITVLLSIAVFMTIVSENLPKSSKPMSMIAYILMLLLIFSSLITFITILNLRLYYKDESKTIPKWLEKLLRFFRRQNSVPMDASDSTGYPEKDLGYSRKSVLAGSPKGPLGRSRVSPLRQSIDLQAEDDGKQRQPTELHDDSNRDTCTWKDVSQFVDTLSFLGFLFANVACFFLYFIIAYFK